MLRCCCKRGRQSRTDGQLLLLPFFRMSRVARFVVGQGLTLTGINFTKARASKWSKVAILPRPDAQAQVPSANNNILYRIYNCSTTTIILMVGTIRSARVGAVPIQTKVPSPISWGELFFYKEFSVLPKPSFPALDCQDTSSWNVRTTEIINPRVCVCVSVLPRRFHSTPEIPGPGISARHP